MRNEPSGSSRSDGGVSADAEAVARAADVLARHAVALMDLEGVVSVGVGLDDSGAAAIVLGASRAEAVAAATMPTVLEGVRVVVRVVGTFEARPSD